MAGKKTDVRGKKTATPAPTKAEDPVSPGPSGVPAAAVPAVSRMGNAPDGATPESHPGLFDEFGNQK